MRWLLFSVAILLAATEWTRADNAGRSKSNLDPISDRINNGFKGAKNQKKRGVIGSVPTFSRGYDIPVVRHSILKPFLVKYPMQTVPVGVKIPLRPGNGFKHSVHVGHQAPAHHHGHGMVPAVQKPTHLHPSVARPAQPTLPAQPAPCPTAPGRIPVVFRPIVPAVHFTPAAAPAVPLTPLLPLPLPPPPFITKPLARPFIPVASPVPVAPVAPVTPTIIKPGHSVQTSFFATYPRHPIVPGGHVVPLSPVAPLAPAVPLGHVPYPVHQPPFNLAPQPLHVNRIPLNVFNPVPHVHHAPAYPVNVGHPPLNVFHHAPIPAHPIPDIPINFHHGFVSQAPTNVPLGVGEIPGNVGQNTFYFERPHIQFSSPGFVNPSEAPGVQEQGNENNFIHTIGGEGSGVWTPMTTSATQPQYPTDQFIPETEAPTFPNQDGSNVNPTTDHVSQGYHYQAPNVPFHEVNQQHQFQQEQHQQDQFQNAQFASNIQHEPQIPQSLPDHHLAGKPINEEYQNHFPLRQHLPLSRPYENFAGYQQ